MAKKSRETEGTPALRELAREQVSVAVHTFEHDPRVTDFGAEAAAALGVRPERVFKTLLILVDGGFACAVLPVTAQLDLKAAAAALGGKRAQLAETSDAERRTGYVRGGISPVGQRLASPTVIDSSAHAHATIFVSGGKRGLDLELTPDALITATAATTARITRNTDA